MSRESNKRRRRKATMSTPRLPSVLRLLGRIALLALVTGVGTGAGYLGVWVRQALASGELFDIRDIRVEGAERAGDAEILSYADLAVGRGLYSFDARAAERAIAQHPMVVRARVVRRPPHQLRILIVEEQPVALVAFDRLYVIDAQGRLFARAEALGPLDLPLITGLDPELVEGPHGRLATAMQPALDVLAALTGRGIAVADLSQIHLDPDRGVGLVLRQPRTRVEMGRGDYGVKAFRLKRVLVHLGARGREAEQIYFSDGPDPRRVVVRLVEAGSIGGAGGRATGTSREDNRQTGT